jgi:hypothetical protein
MIKTLVHMLWTAKSTNFCYGFRHFRKNLFLEKNTPQLLARATRDQNIHTSLNGLLVYIHFQNYCVHLRFSTRFLCTIMCRIRFWITMTIVTKKATTFMTHTICIGSIICRIIRAKITKIDITCLHTTFLIIRITGYSGQAVVAYMASR